MTIEAMKQALEALLSAEAEMNCEYGATELLRQAIEQAEKQEPVAWKNVAIRLGEELSSVGPDGYYNMTAEQWLDWAMDQQPRGKNSLSQPQREWVGLTDEEVKDIVWNLPYEPSQEHIRAIEAKLKEKNT